MSYFVAKIAGKQYRFNLNDTFSVDRVSTPVGESFALDQILLKVNDDGVEVGTPVVANVSLQANVIEHFRGEKIRVAKFKSKSRYRKVRGFRAELTKIQVVEAGSANQTKKAAKSPAKKKTQTPAKE
jgi:large subunit ribosomal protein L21